MIFTSKKLAKMNCNNLARNKNKRNLVGMILFTPLFMMGINIERANPDLRG